MKHWGHILLALLALWTGLSGCRRDTPEGQLLHAADDCLLTNADSSLMLLSKIAAPERLKGEERASYCLLTGAAKYRTVQAKSDTLLLEAMRYYDRHGTDERRMQAYYYLGGTYADLRDAPRSQKYLLLALDLGEQTASDDYLLLERIANLLGDLYTRQDAFETALFYLHKALQYNKLIQHERGRSFILRDIGRVHSVMHNSPDSAIYYYQKALEIADSVSRPSIIRELAGVYSISQNYELAEKYIRQIATDTFSQTKLVYGQILLFTNRLDSARICLNQALQSETPETQANAAYYLGELERKESNWEASNRWYHQYNLFDDKLKQQKRFEAMMRVESLYNYQYAEQKVAAMEVRQAQQKMFILILALLALIAVFFSIHYVIRYRQTRRKAAEQQQRFMHWQEIHDANEKQDETAEKQAIETFEHDAVYQKFHEDDIENITEEDWTNLLTLIDRTCQQFTHRLQLLSPDISDTDLKIACLIKIDLKPGRIASVLNMSKQGVTMTRSRLYYKIHGRKGSTELCDQFIKQL